MKRFLSVLIAIVLILPSSALAGLNAATDWEVRQNGSANNGGGFKRTASGTDRTLSTSPFVAIDNAAITTSITTNVITFSGGYTATSADVGNLVHMLTGTNVTAGWYEITGQTASTWTVDRNIVTSGTTTNATGNMGGAVDSPATIGGTVVAGNNVYIKYSATATSMGSSNNVSGGKLNCTVSGSIIWQGYDTTRTLFNTDANRPLFDATAGSINLWEITSTQIAVNIKCTNTTAQTSLVHFRHDGSAYFLRCHSDGATRRAFDMEGSGSVVFDAYVTNSSMGTSEGAIRLQAGGCGAVRCVIISPNGAGGAGSAGIYFGQYGFAESCIVSGGSALYGIFPAATGSTIRRCVVYGTTHRGFGSSDGCSFEECIAYGNTEDGFYAGSALQTVRIWNCAGGGNTPNTSTFYTSPQLANFQTLTGNPFTNAAGGDFSLDNTSGEGAACRSLGIVSPGISTTSYEDIGATRHVDPSPNTSKKAGEGGGKVGFLDLNPQFPIIVGSRRAA